MTAHHDFPQVLLSCPDAATTRLIKEALEAFYHCRVDAASLALRAYELALQARYSLFIFDLHLETIPGPLLYDLISKAYSHCHAGQTSPPAVIYLCQPADLRNQEELTRDARVKQLIPLPLTINKLLQSVSGTLRPREELKFTS